MSSASAISDSQSGYSKLRATSRGASHRALSVLALVVSSVMSSVIPSITWSLESSSLSSSESSSLSESESSSLDQELSFDVCKQPREGVGFRDARSRPSMDPLANVPFQGGKFDVQCVDLSLIINAILCHTIQACIMISGVIQSITIDAGS